MVRLFGEEVEEGLHRAHTQVDVDEFDAGLFLVFLGDVGLADMVFLVVHGQDLDVMAGLKQSGDDAVHRHGTAFGCGVGWFIAEEKYFHSFRFFFRKVFRRISSSCRRQIGLHQWWP